MIIAVGKRIIGIEVDLKKENKTALILPGDKKQSTIKVVAAGSEVDQGIAVGDIVTVLHDTGIPIEIMDQKFISLVEHQILAAFRPE